MKLNSYKGGYTLVELLVSAAIFTGILGILFSVISAVRRTERFRDDMVMTTQSVNYAFEPIVRAIRESDAVAKLKLSGGTCVTVKGYYGVSNANALQLTLDPQTGKPTGGPTDVSKLVTLDTEKYYDSTLGTLYRWVKKEYAIGDNQADAKGTIRPTIVETVSYIDTANQKWPHPLDSCSGPDIAWRIQSTRYLTSPTVIVKNLNFFLSAPLLKDGSTSIVRNAPFARVVLTLENPSAKIAPTETIGTTITPTFTYGEQRD